MRLLSFLSSFLPIVFFFIFLKRNRQKKLWVIALYLFFSIATDFFSLLLTQHKEENQVSLFVVSTAFTFIKGTIFGYFLYPFLHGINKRISLGVYILAIIVGVYTCLTSSDKFQNDVFLVFEELAIIILCILYFYEQVNNPRVTFLYESKQFWIIISFFFYTTSTLFLFLFVQILPVQQQDNFWLISLIGNIIKNVLVIIAFIKRPSEPTLGKSVRKA